MQKHHMNSILEWIFCRKSKLSEVERKMFEKKPLMNALATPQSHEKKKLSRVRYYKEDQEYKWEMAMSIENM